MSAVSDTISTILQGTATTLVTQWYNRAADAAFPVRGHPLARRSEAHDSRTCPLCRAIDGAIMSREDPRFARWRHGLHINCRGYWSFIGAAQVGPDGKPTRPNFPAANDPHLAELVQKHGHFIRDPEKYAALNAGSRPTGRDFVAYRMRGDPHVRLRWRDNLPDYELRRTLTQMVGGLSDPVSLSLPGDRSLAAEIMGHAAARELFAAPGRLFERHGADWAAALTRGEFLNLPARLLGLDLTGLLTRRSSLGAVEWAVHNPSIPLPDDRTLEDVIAVYRPRDGQYVTVEKLPP